MPRLANGRASASWAAVAAVGTAAMAATAVVTVTAVGAADVITVMAGPPIMALTAAAPCAVSSRRLTAIAIGW